MATARRMKLEFGCWVLTLALMAGLNTGSAAEEAAPTTSSEAKTNHSGTQSPDSSAASENKTPDSGGVNTDDIDTRITVQPHAPPGKSGKFGGTANPVQPLKLVNPHRRTFPTSRAANRISPNASGILNGQRQILQHGPGEHFQSNGVPLSAGTATGAGNANLGLAKPGGTLGREPVFRSPAVLRLGPAAKPLTGGSIGGPTAARRALGASTVGIGGPARTQNGINGTSIRESR